MICWIPSSPAFASASSPAIHCYLFPAPIRCPLLVCLSMLRPRSPQPCSRCLSRRLRRPFDRSTYTSMSSGRSPAESAWPRIAPRGCRGRSWPRFALSSALGEDWSRSSLAPVPRPASPAPSIAESRRLASSREYALLAMLAPRRVCREPPLSASLSSLIAPPILAELVQH